MKKRPTSTLIPDLIETPAFVIEEDLLLHNLKRLRELSQKTGCKILQALKACSAWQLFSVTNQYLEGSEASSLYEAQLGFEEFGSEVHIYAPAYKPNEFDQILQNCSTVIFNSFGQLNQFRDRIIASGKKIEIGLRINPEIYEADGHGEMWNPCAPDSRLGIRLSELKTALEKDSNALDIVSGLHFHIFFEKGFNELKSAVKDVENNFGPYLKSMKWINFGGGQKITDDDYQFDELVELIKDFRKRTGLQVHLEPGAAVVWQTGTLVASVLDIVKRADLAYQIPILDISFEAHLTDFIISPELELKIRGAGKDGEYPHAYKFGGGTCLAGDKINPLYTFPQPLKVGDRVIFEDAIQYTLVKTTMFNGVAHPSIIWWSDSKPQTLRRFGYNDFKSRMG